MPYATVAQFRARYHQISGAAADESLIAEMLDSATAIIDGELGYSFGTAAAGSQVVYGDGTDFLVPPPFVAGSVTAVTAPDGYTVPDYVERDGLLAAVTTGDRLRVRPPAGLLGWDYTPAWREGVPYTVAATFGYADVPADIVEACIQIAGRLWQGRNAGYSDVIGVEGGGAVGYQRALPALVRAILDRYRERSSLGVW